MAVKLPVDNVVQKFITLLNRLGGFNAMAIYLGVSDEVLGVELNQRLEAFIFERKRPLLLRIGWRFLLKMCLSSFQEENFQPMKITTLNVRT